MVELMEGLPDGVHGFRITGELSHDEYKAVVTPFVEGLLAQGDPIRAVIQIGPDFEGFAAGALWEDAKEAGKGLMAHQKWARTAVVTDEEWIRRGVSLFGWMSPGELKLFPLGEATAAIAWAAA